MSKKSKVQQPQQLSPANYIRQKARSLPIHECRVNSNWKEYGMATVMVTRKHNNGNLTSAIYLIDTLCLGIKDTTYQFNLKPEEYDSYVDHFLNKDDCEEITYALAHNIIYAALAYAEEFEFKPHRDFNSITQFMLEEDTDDIELIDIECGKEGKPCYVIGSHDSDQKVDRIIDQLERTAGVDNFYIIDATGEYDDEEDDDEALEYEEAEDDDIEDAEIIEDETTK